MAILSYLFYYAGLGKTVVPRLRELAARGSPEAGFTQLRTRDHFAHPFGAAHVLERKLLPMSEAPFVTNYVQWIRLESNGANLAMWPQPKAR